MSTRNKSERLHMSVTPDTKETIKKLQKQSGASTLSDVVRQALVVYGTLVDILKDGGSLYHERPDGTRERIVIVG